MLVRYAMDAEVVRVTADAGIRAVIQAILAHHQDLAMVTDEHGRVLGVVGLHNILKRLLPSYLKDDMALAEALRASYFEEVFAQLAEVSAADLMEPLAESDRVAPDDGVMKAAALFVEHHRTVLPVFDGDQPVGVISRRGLLTRAIKSSD